MLLQLITDERNPALPMLQLVSHWNAFPMFGFAFICTFSKEALELYCADNKAIHLGCFCPWVCPHIILFIPHIILFIPFMLPWLCGFLHLLEEAVQPPVLIGRLNWQNICFSLAWGWLTGKKTAKYNHIVPFTTPEQRSTASQAFVRQVACQSPRKGCAGPGSFEWLKKTCIIFFFFYRSAGKLLS